MAGGPPSSIDIGGGGDGPPPSIDIGDGDYDAESSTASYSYWEERFGGEAGDFDPSAFAPNYTRADKGELEAIEGGPRESR